MKYSHFRWECRSFSIVLKFSLVMGSKNIRESNGNPLQYSCLEGPMDGEPWWAAVHGVAGNRTLLSNFTFTFHFHPLEKEIATHSSGRFPGDS